MTAFEDVAVFLMDMAARPHVSDAEHVGYEQLLLAHLTAWGPEREEQLEVLLDAPLSWRHSGESPR